MLSKKTESIMSGLNTWIFYSLDYTRLKTSVLSQ